MPRQDFRRLEPLLDSIRSQSGSAPITYLARPDGIDFPPWLQDRAQLSDEKLRLLSFEDSRRGPGFLAEDYVVLADPSTRFLKAGALEYLRELFGETGADALLLHPRLDLLTRMRAGITAQATRAGRLHTQWLVRPWLRVILTRRFPKVAWEDEAALARHLERQARLLTVPFSAYATVTDPGPLLSRSLQLLAAALGTPLAAAWIAAAFAPTAYLLFFRHSFWAVATWPLADFGARLYRGWFTCIFNAKAARVPVPNYLLDRDPKMIHRLLRAARPLQKKLFPYRLEQDDEKLDARDYFFAMNHNSGSAIEILTLLDFWYSRYGDRPGYGQAHPFAFRIPGVRDFIRRVGAVPATFQAGLQVLDSGATLLTFPGGFRESARPWRDRATCDFAGEKGWAVLALRTGRKVIPAAFAGSHAINPVLARGRWIAAAALIPGLLGLREFPVSLSQLLWTPLAGLFAFHFLSPIPAGLLTLAAFSASFALPLVPTRITLRFLAPIDVRAETAGLGRLPARLESAYQRVTTRLQAGLDAMKEAHE